MFSSVMLDTLLRLYAYDDGLIAGAMLGQVYIASSLILTYF